MNTENKNTVKKNFFKEKMLPWAKKCFSRIRSFDYKKLWCKIRQHKKIAFIVLAALVVFLAAVMISADRPIPVDPASLEFAEVSKICELATLKGYYHNVAEFQQDSYGLFGYGYKKLWLEYTSVIDVGIDANQVRVSSPDASGTVQVWVPKAQVFGVDIDVDSVSDPITETGFLTNVSTNDKKEALASAQATMMETARQDTKLLGQAQQNARTLLKRYIQQVGELQGIDLQVEWVTE